MSLQENIKDALDSQDIELANAIAELKNDPAKLSEFISSRKADLYKKVTEEHSDNFSKVFGDLQRATDVTKNILYYHVRNKDLDRTQEHLLGLSRNDVDNATFDSHNAKRQYEINEWTSNNKLDTLFFFQILFIGLTLMVPLLYLRRIGIIPGSIFYGISFLIVVAIVLTVAVRAQYTIYTRDKRYWNRRRFQQMGGPPTLPSCEAIKGLAEQSLASASASVETAAAAIAQQ